MPFFWRFGYLMFTAFNQRILFYIAWTLSDMICIASGLGFNGYEKDGSAKWDLLVNVQVFNFEVCFFWLIFYRFKTFKKNVYSIIVRDKRKNGYRVMEYSNSGMVQIHLF
jgi:hypothetical protein